MTHQCEKCYCKLSAKEEKECGGDPETDYTTMRYICDECYKMEMYQAHGEPDTFSDADPGL